MFSWKGLLDSRRLRESLNSTVKGISTERREATTSCGLNPTIKEIPTERPETTSCGLNPTVKGIPTERPETTTSCGLNPTVKGKDLRQLQVVAYIYIYSFFWVLYVKRREGPRGSEISEEQYSQKEKGWSNWRLRYQPWQVCQADASPQNLQSKFCQLTLEVS
jgi:hypothetical protein